MILVMMLLPMPLVSSVQPSSTWIPPKSLLLQLISPCLLWEKQLVVYMMKIAWWSCWENYTLRWLPLMLLASGFLKAGRQTCWQMHQHPSVGVTDSLLSVSRITQTRRAHQVTAACLHILMKKACEEFTTADLVTCLSPAYNQPVFAPHILRQLERVKRLDIGWTSTKMTLWRKPQGRSEDLDKPWMNVIEVFATLLYDRTSSLWNVNKVRQEVFSRKGRSLPPSQASLTQPVKRTVFQGGYVWGQTLLKQPALPSPSTGWEWQLENSRWVPYWTTLSQERTLAMNSFDRLQASES